MSSNTIQNAIETATSKSGLSCAMLKDESGRVSYVINGERYLPYQAVEKFVDEGWSGTYHDIS
jgi:hypothetical protein